VEPEARPRDCTCAGAATDAKVTDRATAPATDAADHADRGRSSATSLPFAKRSRQTRRRPSCCRRLARRGPLGAHLDEGGTARGDAPHACRRRSIAPRRAHPRRTRWPRADCRGSHRREAPDSPPRRSAPHAPAPGRLTRPTARARGTTARLRARSREASELQRTLQEAETLSRRSGLFLAARPAGIDSPTVTKRSHSASASRPSARPPWMTRRVASSRTRQFVVRTRSRSYEAPSNDRCRSRHDARAEDCERRRPARVLEASDHLALDRRLFATRPPGV
jgi:hypothetical protein